MKRRDFINHLGASALGLAAIQEAFADGTILSNAPIQIPTNTGVSGRVVVVGGGMAGTTAAKFLRLWGGTGVEVTLVATQS